MLMDAPKTSLPLKILYLLVAAMLLWAIVSSVLATQTGVGN
jgi:hypothetical protein